MSNTYQKFSLTTGNIFTNAKSTQVSLSKSIEQLAGGPTQPKYAVKMHIPTSDK